MDNSQEEEEFDRSCLSGFTEPDHKVLIAIVKAAQIGKVKGSKGEWKEFLDAMGKKNGSSTSDPARRSWQDLASFVQTFTSNEDIQMVRRRRLWDSSRKQQLEVIDPWAKTLEQDLVHSTFKHSRFKMLYNFPSYDEGWVQTKRGRSTDACTPERLLSLDCEMVLCDGDVQEVVQICIVDRNFETLMNTLVKPSKTVVDYLTHITGLSAEDLEKATCSQLDAQKQVKKLLNPGTILIGHSLYHDLKVLKIHHNRVIDTSLIFKHHNRPESYSPSLKDLCKAVLGFDFREEGKPHNCLDDAVIPMQLVLHVLKHGPIDPLRISKTKQISEEKNSQLFIHKVPSFVSTSDIRQIFPAKYQCILESISRRNAKPGTTFAVFKSREEADSAFESVDGKLGEDSWGRMQKLVALSISSRLGKVDNVEICVRKMQDTSDSCHEELEEGEIPVTNLEGSTLDSNMSESILCVETPCKRRFQNGDSEDARRLKRTPNLHNDQNGLEHREDAALSPCEHIKEIESLKRQLKARDAEIQELQKLVSSLQGLEGAS